MTTTPHITPEQSEWCQSLFERIQSEVVIPMIREHPENGNLSPIVLMRIAVIYMMTSRGPIPEAVGRIAYEMARKELPLVAQVRAEVEAVLGKRPTS